MPFRWVVADTVYGVSEIERALRQAGKGYVLGVAATVRFHSWGKQPYVDGLGSSKRYLLFWSAVGSATGEYCQSRLKPFGSSAAWNFST